MSYPDSEPSLEDLLPVREQRRRNLELLVSEYAGVEGLSHRLDMASVVLSNYLKPWDGQLAGIKGTIDDSLSRLLEASCDKPLDWFDAAHDAVSVAASGADPGATSAPPIRSVDPESPLLRFDLVGQLRRQLTAAGLETDRHGDTVVIGDGALRLEAQLHEYRVERPKASIRLRVAASCPRWGADAIVEWFDGYGQSRDATESVNEAVGMALAGMTQPWLGMVTRAAGLSGALSDGVSVDRWSCDGVSSSVFSASGNAAAPRLGAAYGAFGRQLQTLFETSRVPGPCGVTVALTGVFGRLVHTQVNRANRPWPQAHALLVAFPWPRVEGYESIRHFYLMVPD